MRRTLAAVLALVALLAAAVASERQLQRVEREDPLGHRLLYLPTPEMLRLLSLGNPGLAADLVYLWSIQYYSQFRPTDRFLYLESVYHLITDLDPHFFDAYRIGGLILGLQSRVDPAELQRAATRLYDKGLNHMPERWELAEHAAWDMYIRYRDIEEATRYMAVAAEAPGAQARIVRIVGRWRDQTRSWTLEDSIQYWRQAVAEAERDGDDYAARWSRSHLYDVMAELHRSLLDPVLAEIVESTGRCPAGWEEVVAAGRLGDIPRDEYGNAYGIDRESCTMAPLKHLRSSG